MDVGGQRRVSATIDSNVLLGRHRKQLLVLASLGIYTLVTSPYIVDELRRIMQELRWRPENRDALLHALLSVAVVVDHQVITGGNYDRWLLDSDDHPVLATALAGQADYLVTDNIRHFPPKKRFADVTIVTSEGFLALLQH